MQAKSRANKKITGSRKKKKSIDLPKMLKKSGKVIRSFRVSQWQLAIDTGDAAETARLYGLNFLPMAHGHLQINFSGQNYFLCEIRNRPWRILLALIS